MPVLPHIHNIQNAVDEIVVTNSYKNIVWGNNKFKKYFLVFLLTIVPALIALIFLLRLDSYSYWYLLFSIIYLTATLWYIRHKRKKLEKKVCNINHGKKIEEISHEKSLNYLNKYWLSPANSPIENIQIIDSMISLCDYEKNINKIPSINAAYIIAIISPVWTVGIGYSIKYYPVKYWIGLIMSTIYLAIFINRIYHDFYTEVYNKNYKRYDILKGELLYLKIIFLHTINKNDNLKVLNSTKQKQTQSKNSPILKKNK